MPGGHTGFNQESLSTGYSRLRGRGQEASSSSGVPLRMGQCDWREDFRGRGKR